MRSFRGSERVKYNCCVEGIPKVFRQNNLPRVLRPGRPHGKSFVPSPPDAVLIRTVTSVLLGRSAQSHAHTTNQVEETLTTGSVDGRMYSTNACLTRWVAVGVVNNNWADLHNHTHIQTK